MDMHTFTKSHPFFPGGEGQDEGANKINLLPTRFPSP